MLRTVKISDKGQIAIPCAIRQRMGIERGDELILLQVDNKLLLEKSENASEKMKDDFKDILKFSEKSLQSVWDNKEDEVWSRYLIKWKSGKKR